MAEFLYIHIPFCARKCVYCDFLSIPYDESLAEHYTHALCRELDLKKGLADTLKTIFFGGGTPTILSENCFHDIFNRIRENYIFAPSAEITVEANPGTLTERKVTALVNLGVNRLSLGVQSFQNEELKTLGRIHDADEAIRSAEMISAAGIENFSLDLIYGIPGQNMQTWKHTLQQAVALSPKHISAYELTPEPGTQLKRFIEAGDLKMPDEETILEMSDLTIDMLAQAGYEQYEISNYARPGYRCTHNMNYWDRGDYIGIGAGAHGFIRGFRTSNTRDIKDYIGKLQLDIIPEIEKTEISCEDALREFIFLGLRKAEGIRLSDAADLELKLHDAGADMVRDGFAAITKTHFRLTGKGRYIANTLIVQLLENLDL
ncbi:MAG: radical SAM family heme chaperone HemW [Nitrospirae bacterium]|nr:radical SAM family heme chaperone HemW [Nitrospirota bacterium]